MHEMKDTVRGLAVEDTEIYQVLTDTLTNVGENTGLVPGWRGTSTTWKIAGTTSGLNDTGRAVAWTETEVNYSSTAGYPSPPEIAGRCQHGS